jgi:hypothetical protein
MDKAGGSEMSVYLYSNLHGVMPKKIAIFDAYTFADWKKNVKSIDDKWQLLHVSAPKCHLQGV